jgi:hypothetical protein
MKLTLHELFVIESALKIAVKFYPDAKGEVNKLVKKIDQMKEEAE